MFTRFASVRAQDLADTGELSLLASTDAAVSMGDWYESLSHVPGAVDVSAARSLLLNHNPDLILGAISAVAFANGECNAMASVDAAATLPTGINARAAVKSGALRGVSIRYQYENKDATWNAETRTLSVSKWRMLEVTLTPIPADACGTVRALPDIPSISPKETPVSEPIDQTAALRAATERADKAEREIKLRSLAADHGVDAKGLDFASFPTVEAGVVEMLARKAKQMSAVPAEGVSRTDVTADEGDKVRAAATAAFLRTARITPEGADKALIEKHRPGYENVRNIIEKFAALDGVRGSAMDVAAWAVGHIDLRTHGRRDAANKSTAGFSSILANVATKAVLAGIAGYNQATWDQWCTQRMVPNFLSVSNVGLASGRLVETAENEAFPELLQKDGGYSAALGLFGATVSLTYQMLVNDQLGVFMGELRRAGAQAALTVDRECYAKLLTATWTNDTSTGAALTTIANLDKPRAALTAQLSPAGEKMGIKGRFVLHDPANALPAQQATGAIYTAGQTTVPSLGSKQIIPIESHWIGDTALLAGALATDYYLAGDGNLIDTVLVNFLEGVGMSPIIMPFDAGATAAEKWKIMLPFRATVATHADSASLARVSGLQKATVL